MRATTTITLAGVGVMALSLVLGLQSHYRQVCVERGLLFCSEWGWEFVGTSLAPWAVAGVVFGILLIVVGVGLRLYPRLKKELKEED